jgi:hypothetical protein
MRKSAVTIQVLLATLALGIIGPTGANAFLDLYYQYVVNTLKNKGAENRWDSFGSDVANYQTSHVLRESENAVKVEQNAAEAQKDQAMQEVMEQFASTDLFVGKGETVTPDPPDTEMWEKLRDTYAQDTTSDLDLTFTYSVVLREKLAAYTEIIGSYEAQGDTAGLDFRSRLRLQNRMDAMEAQLLGIRVESARNAMCQRIVLAEEQEQIRRRKETRDAERSRAAVLSQ